MCLRKYYLAMLRCEKLFGWDVLSAYSLVVSASQDAGGCAISRQSNPELHLGCHTCWLSYFTLVCLWCGRSVGRSVACSRRSDNGERCEVKRSTKKIKAREEAYGHVITKISRMGRLPNFLTHSALLRVRGAPLLVDYPPPRGVWGRP